MTISEAVILAAGEGSRMRPLTYARPKVMLPLANRPILEHLLLEMVEAGIKQFIFVVGYHDEEIRHYFGSGAKWNAGITYVNQRKQAGTGDALHMVDGLISGNFLVLNGDVLIGRNNISRMTVKNDITLAVFRAKDVAGLGVIETSGDKVVRIYEKSARPPSNLANAGMYLFTPLIFDAIAKTGKSPRGEYEITDAIQVIIDSGHPVCYHEIDSWSDLSYPWDLLSANELEMGKITPASLGEIEPNVTLKGTVAIGEKSVIKAGSYITGPVIIGRECEIGPNCYIRAGTAIGDGCHIGAAVEIKNSIIMSGTRVPHHNYIGDSIIGQNCNLGAGTKIANLRLDKKEVVVGNINTGRRKMGAIIGDGVQTGINVSIDTGCLIGDNSFIGPGAVVHGTIAPETRIY